MAALLLAGCAARPSGPPASVVLVTIDTLRADRVGAFGGPSGLTPAFDRLAAAGVRFDAAWAAAPLTLPSHASLMTALDPPHHGLRSNGAGRLPDGVPTLAAAMAGAGRRTAAFVGSFVLDHRFGLDRGFATYDDEIPKAPGRRSGLEAERPGRVVVDRALAWLEAERRPAPGSGAAPPFFLWVHLYDPHAPYEPPEPFRTRYAGHPYDGEVAEADAQLGRLLDALDRLGLAATTIVAVAADHGEALGDHGEPTHGLLLYEPTLHVPLAIRGPGLAPRRVAEPVGLVDLGRTLAGLAGVAWPRADGGPAPDGRDLSDDLRAGRAPGRVDLYAETEYPRLFGWSALAAVRRGPIKYIRAPRPELYDLAADPSETHDLRAEMRRPAAELAAVAEAVRSGARQAPAAPDSDAEARARLASLGYVAGNPEGSGSATAADPKDRVALFARLEKARDEMEAGALEPAATALRDLVEADPGNPVFRGTLAEVLRRLGDRGRAVEEARRAVAGAPGDAAGWLRLARAFDAAARPADAVQACREALRLDPAQAEGWNLLGVLVARAGDPEAARADFERALAEDPSHATAANNLGNALRALGRIDAAIDAYRKATELAPDYPDPWNGWAVAEVTRGDPAAALPEFEKALALAPMQHETLLNRAIAYQMLGDRARAEADLGEFLRRTENDSRYADQRRAAHAMLAALAARSASR